MNDDQFATIRQSGPLTVAVSLVSVIVILGGAALQADSPGGRKCNLAAGFGDLGGFRPVGGRRAECDFRRILCVVRWLADPTHQPDLVQLEQTNDHSTDHDGIVLAVPSSSSVSPLVHRPEQQAKPLISLDSVGQQQDQQPNGAAQQGSDGSQKGSGANPARADLTSADKVMLPSQSLTVASSAHGSSQGRSTAVSVHRHGSHIPVHGSPATDRNKYVPVAENSVSSTPVQVGSHPVPVQGPAYAAIRYPEGVSVPVVERAVEKPPVPLSADDVASVVRAAVAEAISKPGKSKRRGISGGGISRE